MGKLTKNEYKISKFLSLILRHKPEIIGIRLDDHGWANVDELLAGMAAQGTKLSKDELISLVCKETRYRYNPLSNKIKALHGHSLSYIKQELPEVKPPVVLYHGTGECKLEDIFKDECIKRMKRNSVHLSENVQKALDVGKRHGKARVFLIAAQEMFREGYKFSISEDGVWLTDHVPERFFFLLPEKMTCKVYLELCKRFGNVDVNDLYPNVYSDILLRSPLPAMERFHSSPYSVRGQVMMTGPIFKQGVNTTNCREWRNGGDVDGTIFPRLFPTDGANIMKVKDHPDVDPPTWLTDVIFKKPVRMGVDLSSCPDFTGCWPDPRLLEYQRQFMKELLKLPKPSSSTHNDAFVAQLEAYQYIIGNDACLNSSMSDFCSTLTQFGFVCGYQNDFLVHYPNFDAEDTEAIYYKADEGLIVYVDSCKGKVNSARLYGELALRDPDAKRHIPESITTWDVDGTKATIFFEYEFQYGLRNFLRLYRSYGFFLPVWNKVHHEIFFLNHVQKDRLWCHEVIEGFTRCKIKCLPDEAKWIMQDNVFWSQRDK